MAKPGVIEAYLSTLSAELPAPIVEELADGLAETCQRYLDHGLGPDSAADAALAEFGDPSVILAEFTRLSPARRAARRQLAIGPVVGGCWGMALITGRAWSSRVPAAVRLVPGVARWQSSEPWRLPRWDGGIARSAGQAPPAALASRRSTPSPSSPPRS